MAVRGSNPNLPDQILPQRLDIMGTLGEIAKVKRLQAISEQEQQEMALKQKAAQEDAQFKQAMAETGGDPAKVMPLLMQINPVRAMAFQKLLTDQQESTFKQEGLTRTRQEDDKVRAIFAEPGMTPQKAIPRLYQINPTRAMEFEKTFNETTKSGQRTPERAALESFATSLGKTPDDLTYEENLRFRKEYQQADDKAGGTGKTTLEDRALAAYAAKIGKPVDQLTYEDTLKFRKEYQQVDDRPINVHTGGRELTPNAKLMTTRQLRNDFNRETASARTVEQQLALMRSSLEAVKKGSAPAGSQGVLVTFQKILDPTSVVRESEYARSASGLSLLGRLEGSWMKIQQGGAGVTAKDLEQFVGLAEQFAVNQRKFAAESKAQIDSIADEFGLNKALITRDVGTVNEAAAAASGFSVVAPDGKTYTFKTAGDLAKFKARAGIK